MPSASPRYPPPAPPASAAPPSGELHPWLSAYRGLVAIGRVVGSGRAQSPTSPGGSFSPFINHGDVARAGHTEPLVLVLAGHVVC